MSNWDDDLELGKRWVEERIYKIARELDKQIESIVWKEPTWKMPYNNIGDIVPVSSNIHRLLVIVDGRKKRVKFSEDDLAGFNTPENRKNLEAQIWELFEQKPPEKRVIGFERGN